MKTTTRIFVTTIIFIMMFGLAHGQNEYRRGSINISVPSIVEIVKKTRRFETGKVIQNTNEQQTYIGINVNLDNMKLSGNNFSGLKVTTYPVSEEIISFMGVFSDDKQKIKSISIELNYVKYNIADRSKAHIEETKTANFTFENIPKYIGGYAYDHETSQIKNAEWQKHKYLKYRAISETTNSKLKAIDNERITKYTKCISVRLRPTNYTAEYPDRNKVAVITAGCNEKDKECGPIRGIFAKLNHKFSKESGLIVLERQNIDKLIQEQKLSESGLVSKDSKIESGKIIDEDILVIIQLQEHTPDDPPNTYLYKLLVRDKKTGKLDNTGISYRFSMDQPNFDLFVTRAYAHVMKNYFK